MRAARPLLAALGAIVAACQTAPVRSGPPLPEVGEGEAWVYLEPFPAEAQGLSFEVASVAAVEADGTEVPLHVRLPEPASGPDQRLLASGALLAGRYTGIVLRVPRARIRSAAGASDLLVADEPIAIAVPFTLKAGNAIVLSIELAGGASVESRFRFAPVLTARVPARPAPDAVGWVSSAARDALFAFDRRERRVVAVVPVGAGPRGVARDPLRRRVYVALDRADAIEVVDAAAVEPFARVRLELGDRPQDVAVATSLRTLVVLNRGSRTVSFVDPESLVESQRLPIPEDARLLRLDRSRTRAHVLHGSPPALSIVDVGARRLVRTIPTEAEPVWAEQDRTGRRLYVVHRDLPFLDVYSVPEYVRTQRVFVGVGAKVVYVDPRTDLLYVGDDRGTLTLYDPISFVPLESVPLPGAAGRIEVDDLENMLFATVPSRGQVAIVDLVRRRVVSRLEVGDEPFDVVVPAPRSP